VGKLRGADLTVLILPELVEPVRERREAARVNRRQTTGPDQIEQVVVAAKSDDAVAAERDARASADLDDVVADLNIVRAFDANRVAIRLEDRVVHDLA